MKKHLFTIFALSASLTLLAQTVTVRDYITHQPVEFATIYSINPVISTITDARGRADISAFKGLDSIYFRYMGYEPIVRKFSDIEKKRFVIYLKPSDINLDEVIVSASKWKQQKNEVPLKIVVIKPIDMMLENPQTAADMLGSSGTVYIQKSQLGGGSPMIRGFATNRVLIAVDGVRMNNAIFRSGNLQNVISLDPFAVNTTEVIFGPGSVIYGSDAIGGVMSFYTLEPEVPKDRKFFIKGNATTRYASANNERTGHLDINSGFQNWSFLSSITLSDFNDLKMGSHGPDEYLRPEYADRIQGKDSVLINPNPERQLFSGYGQMNLMQKIRYNPNENLDFIYALHYSATTDVPRYDRLIECQNGKLRDGEWYYGPQKWLMNSFLLKYKAGNVLFDNVNTLIAYQAFEESRHNRGFGKEILSHRTEQVTAISANLDFEKKINEKLQIQYGGEIATNLVHSTGEDENVVTGVKSAGSTRYPDGSAWNSLAFYLSSGYHISNVAIIQTGIRYNIVNLEAEFDTAFYPFPFTNAAITNGALTGSAGLVVNPNASTSVGFNLSTGFRSPNIDDAGKVFDSEPGSVVVPNPGLKQEYAYNAEVSLIKIFKDRFRTEASVFFTYLDNAMVRRDFSLNGSDSLVYNGEMSRVQAIQNAAKAWVWGIQAGVDLKLPAGFGISAKINYQKGREELDNGSEAPLRHAAPLYGNFHLTYSANRFKITFYEVFNGGIPFNELAPSEQRKPHLYALDSNDNPYSPSWHTLNLKAIYQITDNILLSSGIENITNQRYRMYSSGITAPGINFIISLKAAF
ncbi:MAG: TonB-dependent receptor [Bacteroidales bacterium]|nr:TonB-dependent receptor [Bacteroidales bacterium]